MHSIYMNDVLYVTSNESWLGALEKNLNQPSPFTNHVTFRLTTSRGARCKAEASRKFIRAKQVKVVSFLEGTAYETGSSFC